MMTEQHGYKARDVITVYVSSTPTGPLQMIFDQRMRALVEEMVLEFHEAMKAMKVQEERYKEMEEDDERGS